MVLNEQEWILSNMLKKFVTNASSGNSYTCTMYHIDNACAKLQFSSHASYIVKPIVWSMLVMFSS